MLKIENLSLSYGSALALQNIRLEAKKGRVLSLLGRNGMGKTSLIRALAGQNKSSGLCELESENIQNLNAFERARKGIAVVPQGREIFPLLSVQENLETGFACLSHKERKIEPFIFELFPVLETMRNRRGGDLSGGQQQQLSIARALVMKPKVLLLDEPTEGIQPSVIKDIAKAIALLRVSGEMAIILVEQYYEFARDLADDYAVIEKGQIVLQGTRLEMNEEAVLAKMKV
jgi:urea transport system ATP-binding protein